MPDMLVNLYSPSCPTKESAVARAAEHGILVFRGMTRDRHLALDWVQQHFGPFWADQCETAMMSYPTSCYLAVKDKKVVGFACYNATRKGMFGPMGVDESLRGAGVGTALLLCCLDAMREAGYAYAVIGQVGPKEFYRKTCGAIEIPGAPYFGDRVEGAPNQ